MTDKKVVLYRMVLPDHICPFGVRAKQLLERHGVVTRGAVVNERVPGGFAAVYKVLSAFEESGRCRRGYFVEGLAGEDILITARVVAVANAYPWPPALASQYAAEHGITVSGEGLAARGACDPC